MRIIIIENSVYRISEKEFKTLSDLQSQIKDAEFNHSEYLKLEELLNRYVDIAKLRYNYLGEVDFDCRR